MTDLFQPKGDDRENAWLTAAAHTAVSQEVEAFLRRAPAVPTPADIAEYSALVAREELLRAERQAAAEATGFSLPSVGTE